MDGAELFVLTKLALLFTVASIDIIAFHPNVHKT
jgi:hypothetical protein